MRLLSTQKSAATFSSSIGKHGANDWLTGDCDSDRPDADGNVEVVEVAAAVGKTKRQRCVKKMKRRPKFAKKTAAAVTPGGGLARFGKDRPTTAKRASQPVGGVDADMPKSWRRGSRSPSPFTAAFLAKTSLRLHTYSTQSKPDRHTAPRQSTKPAAGTTGPAVGTTGPGGARPEWTSDRDNDSNDGRDNDRDEGKNNRDDGRDNRGDGRDNGRDNGRDGDEGIHIKEGKRDKEGFASKKDVYEYVHDPPKWSKYIEVKLRLN